MPFLSLLRHEKNQDQIVRYRDTKSHKSRRLAIFSKKMSIKLVHAPVYIS